MSEAADIDLLDSTQRQVLCFPHNGTVPFIRNVPLPACEVMLLPFQVWARDQSQGKGCSGTFYILLEKKRKNFLVSLTKKVVIAGWQCHLCPLTSWSSWFKHVISRSRSQNHEARQNTKRRTFYDQKTFIIINLNTVLSQNIEKEFSDDTEKKIENIFSCKAESRLWLPCSDNMTLIEMSKPLQHTLHSFICLVHFLCFFMFDLVNKWIFMHIQLL